MPEIFQNFCFTFNMKYVNRNILSWYWRIVSVFNFFRDIVVYKNVSGYFLLNALCIKYAGKMESQGTTKTKCGEIAKCHVFNSVIYFSVQYLTSFPISAVFNSATCLYLMICVCRSTIFPLLILYNDVRNPMSLYLRSYEAPPVRWSEVVCP
jgi:hypothetical protein